MTEPGMLATRPAVRSALVTHRNADLIAAVAPLWIPDDALVVDVTYGNGGFWKVFRPDRLVAHDLDLTKGDGVSYHCLPEGDGSVDVVVFDPPYVSTGSVTTSTLRRPTRDDAPEFYDTYGLGKLRGWQRTFADMALGLTECARVARPCGIVLVKCCDYVESGQKRWGRRHMVDHGERCGLRQVDEFVHVSGTGPQPKLNRDGTPRRQVHSRRAHSFLLVFEKKG